MTSEPVGGSRAVSALAVITTMKPNNKALKNPGFFLPNISPRSLSVLVLMRCLLLTNVCEFRLS